MELCDKIRCTGCGACVNSCPNGCILMVRNSQGFDYPVIDDVSCVKCGLCEKVCSKVKAGLEERTPRVYSATLKDEKIIKKSSSGGAAYALAKKCIENGGVVFGAAYNDSLQVRHIAVSSCDELQKLQGSKYVQSMIGSSYKEAKDILQSGKKVMFFGTPCQIHGLQVFLTGDDMENLVTCDLLCAGVPSPGLFEKYISELRDKYGEIENYNFRSKKYGYGFGYLIQSIINGKEKILTGDDASFVKTMSAGFVRESCLNCKFRNISRVGDITIGDFGDLEVPYEQWKNGISVILANTSKGEKIIKSLTDEVIVEERTLDDCIKLRASSLKGSKKKPVNYNDFFIDYPQMTWGELSKKYLMPKSVKKKIVELVPPFIMAFVRNFRRKMHS